MRRIEKEESQANKQISIRNGRAVPVGVAKKTGAKKFRRNAFRNDDGPTVQILLASDIRVSKHEPDALAKLQMKLDSLLALEENMRRTDEFLKNHDRAGLLLYGYSAEGVEELFLRGPGQQLGYSEQEFSIMAKEIDGVRNRMAQLSSTTECMGGTNAGQSKLNPVSFKYPQLPLVTVRQLLGKRGDAWHVSAMPIHSTNTPNGSYAEQKNIVKSFTKNFTNFIH